MYFGIGCMLKELLRQDLNQLNVAKIQAFDEYNAGPSGWEFQHSAGCNWIQ